jgi:hypothetical protein
MKESVSVCHGKRKHITVTQYWNFHTNKTWTFTPLSKHTKTPNTTMPLWTPLLRLVRQKKYICRGCKYGGKKERGYNGERNMYFFNWIIHIQFLDLDNVYTNIIMQ